MREYSLASIPKRVFAYLIDLFIILAIMIISSRIYLYILGTETFLEKMIYGTMIFFILYGYFVIFQLKNNSQTLGKQLFNIKTIKGNGENIDPYTLLVREIFLKFIFSTLNLFYSLFSVFITKEKLALHDKAGDTRVINLNEKLDDKEKSKINKEIKNRIKEEQTIQKNDFNKSFRRIGATMIDMTFSLGLAGWFVNMIFVINTYYLNNEITFENTNNLLLILIVLIAMIIIASLIDALFTKLLNGSTFGKRLLNLRVYNIEKEQNINFAEAFNRSMKKYSLAYATLNIYLFIGGIYLLFGNNITLHDKLSNTKVIRRS